MGAAIEAVFVVAIAILVFVLATIAIHITALTLKGIDFWVIDSGAKALLTSITGGAEIGLGASLSRF